MGAEFPPARPPGAFRRPPLQAAGRGALTSRPFVAFVRRAQLNLWLRSNYRARMSRTDLRRSGIGFASTPTVLMQVRSRRDTRVGLPIFRREFSYAKRRDIV